MAEGVIPGGGAALLSCRARLLERAQAARDIEERLALRILISAMEAPGRALAENAGIDSSYAIAAAEHAGPGFAMDVKHGTIVDMAAVGMFDSHACISAAVRHSIESAGQALTVETLVLHRSPTIATSP
jgi:chaperonin GroEL